MLSGYTLIYTCDNSTHWQTLQAGKFSQLHELHPQREQEVIQKSIQCSFPEQALFADEAAPGSHVPWRPGAPPPPQQQQWPWFCSHLPHLTLMPLLFRPSATISVTNIKHRGEDHELGQENVINNLDKYGDGLGRIKERVGGKEVETINRLDLLLAC